MKEMTLSPGEDLFKRGDQGNKLYYIIKGTLEEYIEIGANDKEIVLGQINVINYNKTKIFYKLFEVGRIHLYYKFFYRMQSSLINEKQKHRSFSLH